MNALRWIVGIGLVALIIFIVPAPWWATAIIMMLLAKLGNTSRTGDRT